MTATDTDVRPETSDLDEGSWLERWWFAFGACGFIVGSDYKFRIRDPAEAVSATIDTAILLEVAIYGMVGAWVVLRAGRPPHVRRVAPQVYLMCFFVGLVLLSVTYATFPQYGLVRAAQACIVVMFILLAIDRATRAHMHRFVHLFMVLAVLSVGYGVARPSPPINRLQQGRFTWLAIHPTVSGIIVGLATVSAFAYFAGPVERPGPVWRRGWYLVVLVVVGGATLAAHTRGAVLGTLVGLVVVAYTLFTGRTRTRVLMSMFFGGVLVALAATGQVIAFFVRDEDPSKLTTLNSRTALWSVAVDAMSARPIFGYGIGSARGLFYDDTGLGGGHNAVVNVLVELGLVGLICWTLLLGTLAVGASRIRRGRVGSDLDRSMLLGIIGFLVVDGVFYDGAGSVANIAV